MVRSLALWAVGKLSGNVDSPYFAIAAVAASVAAMVLGWFAYMMFRDFIAATTSISVSKEKTEVRFRKPKDR